MLMRMAKLAARPKRRRSGNARAILGAERTALDYEDASTILARLRAAGVDLAHAPDAAVKDFIDAHLRPARRRPALSGARRPQIAAREGSYTFAGAERRHAPHSRLNCASPCLSPRRCGDSRSRTLLSMLAGRLAWPGHPLFFARRQTSDVDAPSTSAWTADTSASSGWS